MILIITKSKCITARIIGTKVEENISVINLKTALILENVFELSLNEQYWVSEKARDFLFQIAAYFENDNLVSALRWCLKEGNKC